MKKNSVTISDEKVQNSLDESIINSRDGEGNTDFETGHGEGIPEPDKGEPFEKPLEKIPFE